MTRGQGDKGTRRQGEKLLLPYPLISLSPCPLVSLISQRQLHVLFVTSLSLITKVRPFLNTAMPDLRLEFGLALTRANTLSARSVRTLPRRITWPLPVKENPLDPHLLNWKSPLQESNCSVSPVR